jgi:hypothetical protein
MHDWTGEFWVAFLLFEMSIFNGWRLFNLELGVQSYFEQKFKGSTLVKGGLQEYRINFVQKQSFYAPNLI